MEETLKNYVIEKKFIFLLCMYKMVQISKEKYKGRYFWVNRKDLEVESDVVNWAPIFYICDPKNKNTDKN